MTLKISLVLGLVLLSGCVSAGKFHDLEAQDAALQAENEKNKQALATATVKIDELNGKLGITETAKSQLEGSLVEMQRALEDQKKRRAESDKRVNEFRELTEKFSRLVNSGQLSVKVI